MAVVYGSHIGWAHVCTALKLGTTKPRLHTNLVSVFFPFSFPFFFLFFPFVLSIYVPSIEQLTLYRVKYLV